jgi:phage shock protein C
MKPLYRIASDKRIAGVCSGIGASWGIDPAVVRIMFTALFLFWGMGLWIYLFCYWVIPLQESVNNETDTQYHPDATHQPGAES